MISFWKVIWIMITKFQKNQPKFFEKRDALRHNCTNDVISEILPGITKWNFHDILLTISMKVDDILPFWKVTWILLIKIVRQPTSEFENDGLHYKSTHDIISEILPGISKLNFSGILSPIYTKVDDIFLFRKLTWILFMKVRWDIFILKSHLNSARKGPGISHGKNLKKDASHYNCTNDHITDTLSGMSKLNLSGI